MADVSAKDGSQETAVALISLILGYFLMPFIDTGFLVSLFFYCYYMLLCYDMLYVMICYYALFNL
jgi:hypothetical protein